jgi:hypothetical protein
MTSFKAIVAQSYSAGGDCMVLTCPRCGRIAHDEGVVYCPFCGTVLGDKPVKITSFPIVAGIIAIITACMCVAWGIQGIAKFFSIGNYYFYYYYYSSLPIGLLWTDGILGLLGFALGLSGGILSLKRSNIGLGMLGGCCMMYSGIAVILAFGLMGDGPIGWAYGLACGVPTLSLSVLSLAFIGVSGSEFHGIIGHAMGADSFSEYPKSSSGIKDKKVQVCPQCGRPFKQARSFPSRPRYPTIGGILAVVSTGICLIISLFYVTSFTLRPTYYDQSWSLLTEGSLGLVASAFGLAAGLLSLKRSDFWIVMVGISFLLVQGFVIWAALGSEGLFGTSSYGPVLGSPIVVLSILSLASIAVSKAEFR